MTAIVLALLLLLAGGLISLLTPRWGGLCAYPGLVGVALAGGMCAWGGAAVLHSGPPGPRELSWPLPFGVANLAIDGLSAWFLLVIGIVTVSVALYSFGYFARGGGHAANRSFAPLLCALVAALILVVTSADGVLFLLGWEVTSLAGFLLVITGEDNAEARRGAWMYLVATHLGAALGVLPLFAAFVARTGSTSMGDWVYAFGPDERVWLTVLFGLGLLGFGAKAGLMPVHVWLPAAHPVAPSPVSALMSGVVVKMGIYGLLRMVTWLPPLPAGCAKILVGVAVISGVMGVLYALAQRDLKRLLAYSTVENIGIIALGIGLGLLGQSTGHSGLAALGYAGALLHVLSHAIFKGLLFLSAGSVLRATGSRDMERLGGLARQTPGNAVLFVMGAVAICALPPLSGFVSEWLIYGALFRSVIDRAGGSWAPALVGLVALALMGGLALACFARVVGVVFLGEPRDPGVRVHPQPAIMNVAMALLAAACVLIGVWPGLVMGLAERPVGTLVRNISPGNLGAAWGDILASGMRLSVCAAIFGAALIGLIFLRRRMLGLAAIRDGAGAGVAATWGCGYSRPTARMQYTASSAAASLVGSFRVLLWSRRTITRPEGVFPREGYLSTQAPDVAEKDIFEPIFNGFAAVCRAIRTLSWGGSGAAPAAEPVAGQRRGPFRALLGVAIGALRRANIQVYLLFMVLTLIVLFLVESFAAPPRSVHPGSDAAANPPARMRR